MYRWATSQTLLNSSTLSRFSLFLPIQATTTFQLHSNIQISLPIIRSTFKMTMTGVTNGVNGVANGVNDVANGANGVINGTHGLVTSSSPLELLVRDLNKQSKTFTDYLRANGLPEPSFERDAPIINLPPHVPEDIQVAKETLLDHALQIFQLVAGPGEYLQNVITGVSASLNRYLMRC